MNTSSDPQREFAEAVVAQLKAAGFTALWAGGCVRDHLLGKTPKDFDVATNARPEQVRSVFGNRRTLAVGEAFGVIVVLGPNKAAGQIEVATFRSDGAYIDGRRPESVAFSTPEIDAQRRDFTINGMFYDPLERRVLDYVGGEKDLAAGVIRAIGVPQARMEEDKLRMLRAVRFAATFDFKLDDDTADAVREMAEQIHVVSAERISQELRRMLVHSHRHRAIELCLSVALLPQILPELMPVVESPDAWQQVLAKLRLLQAPTFPLAWAALLECTMEKISQSHGGDRAEVSALQAIEAIGRRLKFSNKEIEDAAWLLKHRRALDNASGKTHAQLKRVLAEPLAQELISLIRVRDLAAGRSPADALFCDDFLTSTSMELLNPQPLINGNDLQKAGLKPGPRFKEILDEVRDAQLNGEIDSFVAALELAQRVSFREPH